MLTRLITAGLAAVTLTAALPASAQTANDDARFRAAQDRFERELQIFRGEFDRYQSLRRLPGGYAPRVPDPRYDQGYDSRYDQD